MMIRRRVFVIIATPFVIVSVLIGCTLVAMRSWGIMVTSVTGNWFNNFARIWRGE